MAEGASGVSGEEVTGQHGEMWKQQILGDDMEG